MNEKTLTLVFKKSTGASYSFNLPFPLESVEAADVKALGEAMVSSNILAFKDGSSLASLEKAYIRETNQQDVPLA